MCTIELRVFSCMLWWRCPGRMILHSGPITALIRLSTELYNVITIISVQQILGIRGIGIINVDSLLKPERLLLWMVRWLLKWLDLTLEGIRPVYVQTPICVRVCTILHETHHSDPAASHAYPQTSLHLYTSHQTEAETHVPGIYATVTKGGKKYPRYPYGRKKPWDTPL